MTSDQLSRIERDTAAARDVLAVRRRSAEAWRQHQENLARRDRRRARWAGVFYILRGVAAFLVLAASTLWVAILLVGGLQ